MYRILFVDDEILVRDSISEIIPWNALGFELVGTCENGRDAVAFLEKYPVDVVITDIAMPYMDGLELSKYVYEHFPKTIVVIFSGYDSFSYAKLAIRYRVSEYILKPVTARELAEVLEKIREKLHESQREEEILKRWMKGYVRFTKNEEALISKTLEELVQGMGNLPVLKRELEEYGIDVSAKVFRVLGISTNRQAMADGSENDILQYVRQETQKGYGVWSVFQNSNHGIFILAGSNRPMAFSSEINRICNGIRQSICRMEQIDISIGIGVTVHTLEDLSNSYYSALEALEYQYTKERGSVFDSEAIHGEEKLEKFEEKLEHLTQAIRERDRKLAAKILDDFEKYVSSIYISKSKVIPYLFQLLRSAYEEFCQLQMNAQWEETRASKIIEAGSFRDAMKEVREYIITCMKEASEVGYTVNDRMVLRAMEYLKANYENPDLTLSMLCDYLNISMSHFTNIFKEGTGKTFKEMLTHIRIEKAKQLLRHTDLKNYEIAEKIGCKDPHYFTVLFKKMTGKTPKEFAREI